MKNKTFSFIFLFSITLSSLAQAKTLDESLISLKLKSLDYGSVQTTKDFFRKGTKKTFLTAAFETEKTLFKMEVVFPLTATEFETEKNNLTSVIRRSFEDQPTPYAGEVTNTAKCDSMFKPKFAEKTVPAGKIYILKTLAGSDLGYGFCDKKNITYSMCTAFYYDQSTSESFKISIYTAPKSSCEKITEKFIKGLIKV